MLASRSKDRFCRSRCCFEVRQLWKRPSSQTERNHTGQQTYTCIDHQARASRVTCTCSVANDDVESCDVISCVSDVTVAAETVVGGSMMYKNIQLILRQYTCILKDLKVLQRGTCFWQTTGSKNCVTSHAVLSHSQLRLTMAHASLAKLLGSPRAQFVHVTAWPSVHVKRELTFLRPTHANRLQYRYLIIPYNVLL